MLTEDQALACASELGISEGEVTDDIIELVKRKLSLEFSHWPELIKSILREATKCPLGLKCYPSCYWWKDGKCIFPREDK